MPAPIASTQFTKDAIIPPSAWGKDHWSTLAYAETVMVESSGFQVGSDARMRQGRRNFRVMGEQCAAPRRPTSGGVAQVMDDSHGSRLNDGTYVPGHDDWHCIQDMAAAGFFTVGQEGVQPGVTLHLSELGAGVSNALRAHKRAGGYFANFKPDASLLAPPQASPPRRAP